MPASWERHFSPRVAAHSAAAGFCVMRPTVTGAVAPRPRLASCNGERRLRARSMRQGSSMGKKARVKIGLLEAVSAAVTRWTGSSGAFGGAVAVIVVWAALRPVFHYSDTWQLVINTSTTIVTFLM